SFAQGLLEDAGVLLGCDAAEENNAVGLVEAPRETPGVAGEGGFEIRFSGRNTDRGDLLQVLDGDAASGRHEALTRHDDQHPGASAVGALEGARVSQFAAKIQTAQKSKDLAQRRSRSTQAKGERKVRLGLEEHVGALAAAVRGREQEYGLGHARILTGAGR